MSKVFKVQFNLPFLSQKKSF